MTLRFDLGAFVRVQVAEIEAFLREAPLPAEPEGLLLKWPPRPPFRSDRARLQALAAIHAFDRIQQQISANGMSLAVRAANFNRSALLAIAAAEHGTKAAARQVGGGEATGLQRVKAEAIRREIARCLAEGVADKEEMFQRAGVSRATGYRYLRDLSG